jgi:hypothetical protein
MLTRKHFNLLASVVRDRVKDKYKRGTAHLLSDICKDNPMFDEARFFKACGIDLHKPVGDADHDIRREDSH